jgi:hypothetical protein
MKIFFGDFNAKVVREESVDALQKNTKALLDASKEVGL